MLIYKYVEQAKSYSQEIHYCIPHLDNAETGTETET